jgi:hypothetical protein
VVGVAAVGHSYLARAARREQEQAAQVSTRNRWQVVAAAFAVALIGAPAAHAAIATIDGSPLNITASDIGSIQVTFDGSATGEFTPQPSQPAYAGFTASLRATPSGPLSGFSYTAGGGFLFTPASPAPTVTGNGSPTSPFILTAAFDAIGGNGVVFAHVAEQIVYINGNSNVSVAYSIENGRADGATLSGRLFESADLAVAGNSSGQGFFTASPVRQVGGVNPLGNGSDGLLEVTPWSHYQEDVLSTIQNIINSNLATPPSLANTVNPNVVDNAVAVQWDLPSLAAGQGTGESVVWTFNRTGSPTPPAPPVPGKSVVANVVSGTVLVKYPPGFTPRATPAKGFEPFKGAANLPVGTQFDTRKGRVKLTSAADTGGKKTQASDFYDGIFQVKQPVPSKKPKNATALTTDIVLKGQLSRSSCASARAAAVDKKKGPKSVLGKLWGNGKGKFRTRGKYSSATVRGTIWLTQDECDGTLTRVTRGSVQVRDFKRKKTITVKAGHSYLARAVAKRR